MAVKELIEGRLANNEPILSIGDMKEEAERYLEARVPMGTVRDSLQKDSGLSYRRLTHLAAATNSERTLVLR